MKERDVVLTSILLVVAVFLGSFTMWLAPPVETIQVKVFDTWKDSQFTHIMTYGKGKIRLNGLIELDLDATYSITYQSRKRNEATIIHRIIRLHPNYEVIYQWENMII